MVRRACEQLTHPAIVVSRFQFKIGMTERIDDEISDVPCCDPKKVQTVKVIGLGKTLRKPKSKISFSENENEIAVNGLFRWLL